MHSEPPPDDEVVGWLQALGVESLCQWDLLVFLYRHQTSLVGAEHLALLSGYPTERVVAALDVLESFGLVERSRVSQGARLYQFTTLAPGPADNPAPRGEAFERLLALAQHRAGRLLLSKHLRRGGDRTPQEGLNAARSLLEEARQFARAARQFVQEREGGMETWRKAI